MRSKKQEAVNSVLELIDDLTEIAAQKEALTKNEVRLLRPCSFAVFKEPFAVLLVVSSIQTGEIPVHIYFDKPRPDINFKAAFAFCQENLHFKQSLNFVFARQILNYKTEDKIIELNVLVENYIKDEIQNLEKLQV